MCSPPGGLASERRRLISSFTFVDAPIQAFQLCRNVLREEFDDRRPGLMQRYVAERKAISEGHSLQGHRVSRLLGAGTTSPANAPEAIISAITMAVVSSASTSSLGIFPLDLILNCENTENAALANDRHAEEGMINLLACLRLVREGWVFLGIREIDRLAPVRDKADKPSPFFMRS